MHKNFNRISLLLVALLFLNACAGISHGVRIYPQKVYLFVDATKNSARLLTLPDIKNGYDVKPWSFLSKHEFSIKVADGQVSELASDQDSTAALALLQKIVEIAGELGGEALKAAIEGAKSGKTAKPVADVDLGSAFGLASGIWEFNEKGVQKVSP